MGGHRRCYGGFADGAIRRGDVHDWPSWRGAQHDRGNAHGGPEGNADQSQTYVLEQPEALPDINTTCTAVTDIEGGEYIFSADAPIWARNVVVLEDYALPAIPESDPVIFQRPVA